MPLKPICEFTLANQHQQQSASLFFGNKFYLSQLQIHACMWFEYSKRVCSHQMEINFSTFLFAVYSKWVYSLHSVCSYANYLIWLRIPTIRIPTSSYQTNSHSDLWIRMLGIAQKHCPVRVDFRIYLFLCIIELNQNFWDKSNNSVRAIRSQIIVELHRRNTDCRTWISIYLIISESGL